MVFLTCKFDIEFFLLQRQFICALCGINDYNIFYDNLKKHIYEKVGHNASRLNAIEDLGLLSEDLVVKHGNPIDTISNRIDQSVVTA